MTTLKQNIELQLQYINELAEICKQPLDELNSAIENLKDLVLDTDIESTNEYNYLISNYDFLNTENTMIEIQQSVVNINNSIK